MGVDASELIVPFAGAIQASFSVLLTIAFGVVAAQCNLLSTNAAKEVSKLCVRMFLPALLIYKIGSNLHQGTAVRYVPLLSKDFPTKIIYNWSSMY
jgi:predicted permease